jgi:hypothetical protein
MRAIQELHRRFCLASCRSTLVALCLLLSAWPGFPQVELVSDSFFPAQFEFKELASVRSDQEFTSVLKTAGLSYAGVVAPSSFRRCQIRTYEVTDGTKLQIDIVSLADSRAAYSMLTLAREGPVDAGVLGDGFCPEASGFTFCRGSRWVRISGTADPLLMQRIGMSVANRIGGVRGVVPAAVKHLPLAGRREDSLRYFVSAQSFSRYSPTSPITALSLPPDVEIACAGYAAEGWNADLTLLTFPTAQVAEEFLERFSRGAPAPSVASNRLFTRRSGPLVAVLDGMADARKADEFLGKIQYTYSIKWIYDRRNQSGATIWGVPVGILGTVVRSLALTALLCLASVLLGLGMASFRVWLRGYAPNNFLDRPERTELIRLKLDEK